MIPVEYANVAMKDLSEELLDRHFRQQLASYKYADQARAKQSDRPIMARWIKIFEKAPLSEKLARNSLMLLMHGPQDVLRSQPGDVRMLTEFSDRIPYSLMGTCGRVVVAVLKYIEELV